MGCVAMKSRLDKIKLNLRKVEIKLKKLTQQIKQLIKEIEILDDEGRFDEADLKELELQQLSKEKRILVNETKSRKKTVAALEQVMKNNKTLKEQNLLKEKQIQQQKEKNQNIKQQEKLINAIIKEKDEERERLQNIQDLEEEENEEDYKEQLVVRKKDREHITNPNHDLNLNKDKVQQVEKTYAPPNAAYPFEELKADYSHNNHRIQQAQISQVQSFLQN
ncbi:unnamed protein product (macronuclear) [Paramecium tetraurelia]|uniref:Uncharacterized protein n=1 Tax=Paramecium tetraurelia TaxID=5888 RepID=A0D343_PARTE|nr:uncharacterized protein GSPATT00012945001 [Paramecium tetraurelia]CAK77460.1 unnamed protein product [Paramecium tetraurelia]|eukprot:XP_001444857.1 hypothetical protein (macronuclear) [Paramecium tetraurelia strain d4-2]